MDLHPNAEVPFPVVSCTTARELWAALDRTQGDWLCQGERTCDWVFRGQADSAWDLQPSAWRKVGESAKVVEAVKAAMQSGGFDALLEGQARNPRHWDVLRQEAAQCYLLQEFLRTAARVGLEIPDAPYERTNWRLPRSDSETAALAQHFGVPTALLDFTENPRTAMFWATVDVPDEAQQVSVWAFNRRTGLRGVQLPRYSWARNQHLRAQEGVLVHFPQWDDIYEAHEVWPRLDRGSHVVPEGLKRFDLPRKEVLELRRLLGAEGVTHATMVPSWHGAAQAAKQRPVQPIRRQWATG